MSEKQGKKPKEAIARGPIKNPNESTGQNQSASNIHPLVALDLSSNLINELDRILMRYSQLPAVTAVESALFLQQITGAKNSVKSKMLEYLQANAQLAASGDQHVDK